MKRIKNYELLNNIDVFADEQKLSFFNNRGKFLFLAK